MLRAWIVLVLCCGCSLAPAERDDVEEAFVHWDIASCLGLVGGPSTKHLGSGKPVCSAEELAALENAERAACQAYEKAKALKFVGSRGGEPEKMAAAGYELSRAQARLAWAREKPNDTVSRLEQATMFARKWEQAAKAAYEADTVTLSEYLNALQVVSTSEVAESRVKSALTALGHDLKKGSHIRQIDPDNPQPDDCVSK